jgi:ABC-type lipoprotein release transport system permease subunit
MFFTYLRRELRRRMRQAVFIAVGLAFGIGLVITVNAASSGVKAAQGTVLALTVAGGLIAGILGGWRAARLRPAAALARVE